MPPNGGWAFKDLSTGREVFIKGYSAKDVLAQVTQLRKNNNTFTTEKETQYELDYYWYKKTPSRYPRSWQDRVAEPSMLESIPEPLPVLGIEDIGPAIWEFLNLYVFNFDRDQFLSTIERVGYLLNPGLSLAGCDECHVHWLRMLDMFPPSEVQTQEDALSWIFSIHNRVNDKVGKKFFTKEQFKQKYGVELP